jgi:UDP-N-acetylglucosamine transferase subunit ALG13
MARTPCTSSTGGHVAFATVGTTRFDSFTQRLDERDLQTALVQLGIKKLVVQKGNSVVAPRSRVEGLQVEAFEFAQGLQAVRDAANFERMHALVLCPFSAAIYHVVLKQF